MTCTPPHSVFAQDTVKSLTDMPRVIFPRINRAFQQKLEKISVNLFVDSEKKGTFQRSTGVPWQQWSVNPSPYFMGLTWNQKSIFHRGFHVEPLLEDVDVPFFGGARWRLEVQTSFLRIRKHLQDGILKKNKWTPLLGCPRKLVNG